MNLGIANKCALITGAAGAIAQSAARRLRDEGVELVLSDLEDDALDQAAQALAGNRGGDRGGNIECISADLSQAEGLQRIESTLDKTGPCDIMVHAAGVTGAKGDPLEMSDDDWHHAWDTDFMSGVRMARLVVPRMAERGWGRVVFITSENAVQPYADEAVYNAAKAALLNFTKCVSMPYGPKGVRVNAVSPAFIETDMTDGMMKQRAEQRGESFEQAVESFLNEERPFLTLARRGQPDEVSAVIAFLCSDLVGFVNGSAYRVDGGAVAAMNI